MLRRSLISLLLPGVVAVPLIGCSYDHDHEYHARRHRVVREETVVEPVPSREVIVEDVGPAVAPMPPVRREVITVRPYHDAVWHPGHWVREPHRWVWVNGYWR